jgi:hypothetical protein
MYIGSIEDKPCGAALLARRQPEHLGDFPGLELLGVETLAAAIRSMFP